MDKKLLREIINPLLPQYLFAVFCGLLLNILIFGSTFISKILLDKVLPSKDTSLLIIFILGYITYYLFKNLFSFLKSFLFSKHGYKILYEIRNNIFSSIILKFNFTSFSSEKQGYIITLFRDWINSISWFLSNILLNTISETIFLFIGLIILAVVNINIFLITLMTLPLYGLVYIIFNKKIRDNRIKMMDKDVEVTQNLKESLDSIKEIKILNTESIFIEKYNSAQKKFNEQGLKYVIITSIYDSLSNISSILGHIVILYFGSLEVFKGTMTIGTLIALNSIVALLYAPIERIVNFNRLLQVFKIESQKLSDFLKNNTLIINVKNNKDYIDHSSSNNKNITLELNDISFSYDDLKILKNINMEVEKGLSYAIVGENGSGKSTLINLITGLLIPDKGNIFFQGTNIHQFLGNFRKQIGYVHQDTFLLHDSILNNITFGRENVSKYSIEKLLAICEIDNFIKANSLNENTIIGENGSKLSGGQKQKIVLCRALYNNPNLLIIDEGTSNIDSDSEKRIIQNIRNNFPDMAIIIVSHRLSTIKLADYVFVLKNSCIVEKCKINESDNKESIFYKLFSNQFV